MLFGGEVHQGQQPFPKLLEPSVRVLQLCKQPHGLFPAESRWSLGRKHGQAAPQIRDLVGIHTYEHTFATRQAQVVWPVPGFERRDLLSGHVVAASDAAPAQ